MTVAEQLGASLAHRVEAIADVSMRASLVRHELGELAPLTAATLLFELVDRAERGSGPHRAVLLAATIALADADGAPIRDAILGATSDAISAADASEASDGTPRALFAAVALAWSPGPGAREADEGAARVPDFGTARPLTLGERKSLARRRDPRLIARVLADPHPEVVRIVLTNPMIREQDAIALCAKRPLLPLVAREIVRAPRWIVRPAVRLALVRNPYTPIDLALQLAPQLTRQDAAEVARSAELHETLREACARVARRRVSTAPPPA